jgi:hypothetical protein
MTDGCIISIKYGHADEKEYYLEQMVGPDDAPEGTGI